MLVSCLTKLTAFYQIMTRVAQQMREETWILFTLTKVRHLMLSQSSFVTKLGKYELNGWATREGGKLGRIFGLKVIQCLCVQSPAFWRVGCCKYLGLPMKANIS